METETTMENNADRKLKVSTFTSTAYHDKELELIWLQNKRPPIYEAVIFHGIPAAAVRESQIQFFRLVTRRSMVEKRRSIGNDKRKLLSQ
jgi:hypothetical protein